MGKPETILEQFRTDKRKAFRLFYDSYFELLVLFAHQITKDAEAAEDIVQECLVKFWINEPYLTMSSGLDKYIFQAVKYASYNHLRGHLRKKNLYDQVTREMLSDEKDHEENDVLEKIYRSINQLPEERRKVFLMVFVDNMSYQEVADRLHISKNTVKTQLSRSLKFLRLILQDDYSSFLLFFILKK